MRAKQSFTASEMYSCSESTTPPPSVCATIAVARAGDPSPLPRSLLTRPGNGPALSCPSVAHDEGLLHDARNLIGALGLYCDLLAMPGVLKPEHRPYADEVRLLGARSAAMIQRLMEQSLQSEAASACSWLNQAPNTAACNFAVKTRQLAQPNAGAPHLVSLRTVIEQCSGLLGRVASGRAVEIHYGVAAAVPVRVEQEAVERILVNLVRNSAAALAAQGSGREAAPNPTADEPAGTIRIAVGMLVNRVGDAKPWPFRRVRLTVEDSGCGMPAEQVERLLSGGRAPERGCHGIGFRVVQELVAASDGDLRVMSTPGVGTRIQIEWPIAAATLAETAGSLDLPRMGFERRRSC